MPEHEPASDAAARHIEDAASASPEDERVAALLAHSIDVPVLAEAVALQEAADAADTIERLDDEEKVDVLVAMETTSAAEALAEMEDPLAVSVLEDLLEEGQTRYASLLILSMAPDDAADLLQALPDDDREEILREMPLPDAVKLRRLVGYGEETAAGIMTTEFLALDQAMTVGEAVEAIRAVAIPEEINDIPVVGAKRELIGLLTLRSLLLNDARTIVADLLEGPVKAIRDDLDQEEVAREFDRYDYSMLPVVDRSGRLLGIVTVDDVIDIIRAEQTEDVQKTVGAGAGEAVYSNLAVKFRGRFPWLVTSLFMTCLAAIIVLFFEDLIRRQPILAFLMPVVAALVGNAGHQALAVTLRGIVLDEVRTGRVRPLILREAAVGLLNGCALAVVMIVMIGGLSIVLDDVSWKVGVVAGIALAISMAAGTLAGSSIPLVMRRFGADPAQSSAIFLIMITDGVAFSTLLGLAATVQYWLLGPPSAV